MLGWTSRATPYLKFGVGHYSSDPSRPRINTSMEAWWVGPRGSVEGAFWYATDNKPWQTYTVAPDRSDSQSHSVTAASG